MPHEITPQYDVRETDTFYSSWLSVVKAGRMGAMDTGPLLMDIKAALERDPHQVAPIAALASDLRVITYDGKVRIWYCIVEDDRAVYLERVTEIGS